MTMFSRLTQAAAGSLLAGLVLSCLITPAQAQSPSGGDKSHADTQRQLKILPSLPRLPIPRLPIPVIHDHRKPNKPGTTRPWPPRTPWPRPVVRDHRDVPGGVIVRDHRRPTPFTVPPVVRDHRTPSPRPVVRDHREPSGGVVVRDHRTVPSKVGPVVRDHRTPSPRPVVRDHRSW